MKSLPDSEGHEAIHAATRRAGFYSRIYVGQVDHRRRAPVEHSFTYPLHMLVVDLDELPQLDAATAWFGHNRRRPYAIHDADYLRPGPGSLRERLTHMLREDWSYDLPIGRIELVTMPRTFLYAFNPVNFYYIYRPDGALGAALAEVNNTCGERHFYPLTDSLPPLPGMQARYEADKAFHVSPFYDRSGHYEFHFSHLNDTLTIRVDKADADGVHFETRLAGEVRPFTAQQLSRRCFGAPLMALKTMPRILWQAGRLYFKKKLPAHPKPLLMSSNSLQISPPKWRQRLAMRGVCSLLGRITTGRLDMNLPDGSSRSFGEESSDLHATLSVRDYRFFTRIASSGDIGFGEAFTQGWFETEDLTALITMFVRNPHLADQTRLRAWFSNTRNTITHRLRRNSLKNTRNNISAHYDLSNKFFSRFLDPSMMYSCALFDDPAQPLEEAQQNKINALIQKAKIEKDHHVLEIGCGWGAFAIEAVRQTGCRVTGVTLSIEQQKLAEERVRAAGLEDRITIELIDYRNIQGSFDRIVSIEMLEAVGHEFLGTYFSTCDRLLKPDGLVALQVITIPDQRYDAYRKSCDWIQKYIFPGGFLPSLTAMSHALTSSSTLMVDRLDNIGIHYARTLAEWNDRFQENWPEIAPLGFDPAFRRTWHYYLAYCEAAFANRHLNVLHLVLTRPNNRSLDG